MFADLGIGPVAGGCSWDVYDNQINVQVEADVTVAQWRLSASLLGKQFMCSRTVRVRFLRIWFGAVRY